MTEFHTPERAARDLSPGAKTFTIRELCEAFEVTPRALRFYESQGLISPTRLGQRRIYSLRDRARLYLLLRGKRFGFSLAEIGELLDLYDLGDRQQAQIAATLRSCGEKLTQLTERREELEEAITELKDIIARLQTRLTEIESGEDDS